MKTKHYIFTLLAMIVSINIFADSGSTFQHQGLYYYLTTSGTTSYATVTYKNESYNSYSGAVVIPSKITLSTGTNHNVQVIGTSAFQDCVSLTSVIIGDNVATIGPYAFYDCSGLTSIIIPKKVRVIQINAFLYCI